MLTGGQFYDLLCAVVPLYIALFLGYASLKWWRVLTPEQSAGIGRLNSLVAMPALVFQIIAFNNPYTMNNRLIAAYSLSNIISLGKYAPIKVISSTTLDHFTLLKVMLFVCKCFFTHYSRPLLQTGYEIFIICLECFPQNVCLQYD